MNRRFLTLGLIFAGLAHAAAPACADDGEGGGSSNSGNSGSGNSGSGNSGSGDSGGDNGGDNGDDNGGDNGGGGEDGGEVDNNANASSVDNWNQAAVAAKRGEIAPLRTILEVALANTPGKVIDVKVQRIGAAFTYRVKILSTGGRKVELWIDAATRKILKVK
jgi:Peptidase propeptide and YPEB domain